MTVDPPRGMAMRRLALLGCIPWLVVAAVSGCTLSSGEEGVTPAPADTYESPTSTPQATAEITDSSAWTSPLPSATAAETPSDAQLSPLPTPLVELSPTPSPGPTRAGEEPTQAPEVLSIGFNGELDMVPGQSARLADTGIEVTLVEAHGPPEDCTDCPNRATLDVRFGDEVRRLEYSFSGNMVWELFLEAQRKSAYGYVFVTDRVDEGEITLVVEPETE